MARKAPAMEVDDMVDGAALAPLSRPIYDAPVNPAERAAATVARELQRSGELEPEEALADALEIPADFLLQDQLYIRVHRVGLDGKRAYLGKHAPRGFDLETIKGEYGGGAYWVCLVGPNPKNGGRGSIFWQAFPYIEGRPRDVDPPTAVAPTQQGSNDQMLLLEGFRALATGMQQGFQLIAEGMKSQQSQRTLKESLEELALLQGLAPKQPDPMTMFRDVFGLMRDLNPPDPGDSPMGMMMSAAEKIMPMITAVIETSGKQPMLAGNPAIAALPGARAQPQPTQPTQTGDDVNLQQMQLKMGLKFLCGRAEAESDAALQAENVIDHMPDDELDSFVQKPDWFAILCNVEPECAKHEAWFKELRDAVITQLVELNGEPETGETVDE